MAMEKTYFVWGLGPAQSDLFKYAQQTIVAIERAKERGFNFNSSGWAVEVTATEEEIRNLEHDPAVVGYCADSVHSWRRQMTLGEFISLLKGLQGGTQMLALALEKVFPIEAREARDIAIALVEQWDRTSGYGPDFQYEIYWHVRCSGFEYPEHLDDPYVSFYYRHRDGGGFTIGRYC